jgi:hypothetical protein
MQTELRNIAMSDSVRRRDMARAKYSAFLSLRTEPPLRLSLRLLKKKAFQRSEGKFDMFHDGPSQAIRIMAHIQESLGQYLALRLPKTSPPI